MSAPLLLGVEIGGTKLQLGLGLGKGVLIDLERRRVEPEDGGDGIRAQIEEAATALLARNRSTPGAVAALGIGFGGPVDAERGVVTVSNQIEGWAGFPIADWARRTLGIPRVVLQNDADTAALGEARFGAGVGHNPVLYVTIGSGIGGGLIVDGAIYRGSGRGAIEIGHLLVDAPAGPDASGTLEGCASGWSIAREARRLLRAEGGGPLLQLCGGDPSRITAELVARAASRGDAAASSVLARSWTGMGRALAHAVTLLAPRRIILGGGVSLIGEDLWFGPIRRETAERVFPPFRGTYEIVPAALGEEVVVHGALALARETARGQ
jgi:glucokinase